MRRYQPKKKEGFTLIEIIIVLAIMGIIVLIGFPVLKSYRPNLRLSGTVRELINDLRYVEQSALTEQINHGIRFFSDEDKYQIIRYGATEEILEEKYFPPEVNFYLISGFSGNQVIFNPYGAASEPGTITLINTGNSTTTIEIKSSGFVRIGD